MKQEKLQMYFKIEIFNAMGSKVHELVVKSERKNALIKSAKEKKYGG